MPYQNNSELPSSVKGSLPAHAQTIFRKAFNNALKQYDDNEKTAFKVAWAAVKESYKKDDEGKWVKKPD